MEGNRPWGVPVTCLAEFVRVVTHRAILDPPSSLEDAIEALQGLLGSSTLRILDPGPRFPELFVEALREASAKGNLAFDAQIVAICRESGVSRLLTFDRDFSRFSGLRISSPKDFVASG